MTDEAHLRSLLHQRAENAQLTAPDLETIMAAGRSARRRQRSLLATALAAAAAVSLTIWAATGTGRAVEVSAGPTAPSGPVGLAPEHVPAGWRPLDVGTVRLWEPPGWGRLGCGNNTTLLWGAGCPPHAGNNWLLVRPSNARPGPADRETVINGLATWHHGTATVTVPALHVAIDLRGATAAKVLATLEPSGLAAVLATAYPVPVPATWKTARYRNIQFRVPPSWPVGPFPPHLLQPGTCGLWAFYRGPRVDEGAGSTASTCVWIPSGAARYPTDGVWIRPAATNAAHPVTTWTLWSNRPTGMADLVTVHEGRTDISVGIGRNPVLAEQILSSLGLHHRPRYTLPRTATATATSPPASN